MCWFYFHKSISLLCIIHIFLILVIKDTTLVFIYIFLILFHIFFENLNFKCTENLPQKMIALKFKPNLKRKKNQSKSLRNTINLLRIPEEKQLH